MLGVYEIDQKIHKMLFNLLIIGDRELMSIEKTKSCPITG